MYPPYLNSAFNRIRVAAEGSIPILIDYMKEKENDIVGRQYCSMCLGNLAAEPENHQEIVKSDGEPTIPLNHCYMELICCRSGIRACIEVLKTEDIEAGRYAAFALSNIGASSALSTPSLSL